MNTDRFESGIKEEKYDGVVEKIQGITFKISSSAKALTICLETTNV